MLCDTKEDTQGRKFVLFSSFNNSSPHTIANLEENDHVPPVVENYAFDKKNEDLASKNMKNSKSKPKRNIQAYSSDENSNESLSPRPLSRISHNHLERKRRDELKRKFDDLRKSLPELEFHEKAPKVVILTKGIDHIKNLENEDKKLTIQKNLLKSINSMLTKKLKTLTRQDEMSRFRF